MRRPARTILTCLLRAVAITDGVIRRVALVAAACAALAAAYGHPVMAATPKPKPKPSPTKGVVLINTNLALQNGSAAGTGIVLTKTGEVMTNNHVIAGATTIQVTVPATKRTYSADVVGYDISDDVALLQLQGATNLATATTGNSAKLKVGQAARAVGNANGGGKLVVTSGKVLALNRSITVQEDDGETAQLAHLVETSARLVPGDSGGPLLDATGRVIGMDAAGSTSSLAGSPAPGYAIAINHALTVAKQIAAMQASTLVHIGPTAFIGLNVQNGSGGIAVGGIVAGSPAESAGLATGDLITSIDGAALTTVTDLRNALLTHHPGDSVTIGFTDTTGTAGTVTITLAAGPPQ